MIKRLIVFGAFIAFGGSALLQASESPWPRITFAPTNPQTPSLVTPFGTASFEVNTTHIQRPQQAVAVMPVQDRTFVSYKILAQNYPAFVQQIHKLHADLSNLEVLPYTDLYGAVGRVNASMGSVEKLSSTYQTCGIAPALQNCKEILTIGTVRLHQEIVKRELACSSSRHKILSTKTLPEMQQMAERIQHSIAQANKTLRRQSELHAQYIAQGESPGAIESMAEQAACTRCGLVQKEIEQIAIQQSIELQKIADKCQQSSIAELLEQKNQIEAKLLKGSGVHNDMRVIYNCSLLSDNLQIINDSLEKVFFDEPYFKQLQESFTLQKTTDVESASFWQARYNALEQTFQENGKTFYSCFEVPQETRQDLRSMHINTDRLEKFWGNAFQVRLCSENTGALKRARSFARGNPDNISLAADAHLTCCLADRGIDMIERGHHREALAVSEVIVEHLRHCEALASPGSTVRHDYLQQQITTNLTKEYGILTNCISKLDSARAEPLQMHCDAIKQQIQARSFGPAQVEQMHSIQENFLAIQQQRALTPQEKGWLDALQKTIANNGAVRAQTFNLSAETREMLHKIGIDPEKFNLVIGNEFGLKQVHESVDRLEHLGTFVRQIAGQKDMVDLANVCAHVTNSVVDAAIIGQSDKALAANKLSQTLYDIGQIGYCAAKFFKGVIVNPATALVKFGAYVGSKWVGNFYREFERECRTLNPSIHRAVLEGTIETATQVGHEIVEGLTHQFNAIINEQILRSPAVAQTAAEVYADLEKVYEQYVRHTDQTFYDGVWKASQELKLKTKLCAEALYAHYQQLPAADKCEVMGDLTAFMFPQIPCRFYRAAFKHVGAGLNRLFKRTPEAVLQEVQHVIAQDPIVEVVDGKLLDMIGAQRVHRQEIFDLEYCHATGEWQLAEKFDLPIVYEQKLPAVIEGAEVKLCVVDKGEQFVRVQLALPTGKPEHQIPTYKHAEVMRTGEAVWDNIKPTQPCYPNTKIPKSFELHLKEDKFWVAPNATEHLYEFFKNRATHGMPIGCQSVLTDFANSVAIAINNGIEYNTKTVIGNWEFVFSLSRKEGFLPVIHHALYKP